MNVDQLMTEKVFSCKPDDSLIQAAQLMWEHDIGCVPVVDAEGRAVAMITDRDICMAGYLTGARLGKLCAASAMSKKLVTCKTADSAETAEELMRSNRVRRLPVVDAAGKLVGIISLNDLARASVHVRGHKPKTVDLQDVATTLAAICEPRVAQQAAA
jgi:CBS domain-containing protein